MSRSTFNAQLPS